MKTMTPKAKAANRRNAMKSTGPRTPAGKAAVAKNRTLHGLRAWSDLVPGEDQAEFDRMKEGLVAELAPVGAMEEALVARVGSCLWRLWRIQRIEAGMMSHELDGALQKPRSITESMDLTMDELIGRPAPPPEYLEESLESWGLMFIRTCNAGGGGMLDRLSRYETGIERSLHRTLHELERLQRRRQGEATPAPLAVDLTVDELSTKSMEVRHER